MVSFLNRLFGKNPPGRFLSEDAYRANREKQAKMSPMTVEQLRKYGVTDETELKLEYFFYTNSPDKAERLAQSLKSRGYSAEAGRSASGESTFVVTGWTTKMKMTEAAVVRWTNEMSDVGYSEDCDFDGWGTNPSQ